MEISGWTNELLGWFNANPHWGWALVFVISFFESLVLVGILLPGIMILFAMGTLIGLGVLDLASVWIASSGGGMLGDMVSYLLGRRYRAHLLDIWPFSRYPGVMERGLWFFQQHGAKGVVAGRFIGPLRPIIPAVVGIMGMSPSRFMATDVAACIVWAPAFLLPGMLFGASLEVASEYTGRLTGLLVILLVVLWLTWWLIRLVYEPLASHSARWLRRLIRWTWRHPVLGRITGPLLDPSQPEVLSVTSLGILLVVLFWALLMLLFLSPFSNQPQDLDQAVQGLAVSLRNHLADPVMLAIAQLSSWEVSLLSSFALLLWLLGAKRMKAAMHWLVAIVGGWLLQTLLAWSLRATPQVIELPAETVLSPSSAMSLTTVVFVFFAVMIARETRRKHRQWPYLAAALTLIVFALARLYLGLEWLSGALMGILLGLVWTLIVGIAYRQRALQPFSAAMAGLIFYGSVVLLLGWQAREHVAAEAASLQTVTVEQHMQLDTWWEGGWRNLPQERTSTARVASRQFNAQVAADPDHIAAVLSGGGWERVPASGWLWILQALNPEPNEASLPLLGRAFRGRSEALLMRRFQPGSGQLLTLRLWDSGVRLQPGEQILYLAQISEEHLVQRLGLFSYWRSAAYDVEQLTPLRKELGGLEQKPVSVDLLLLRDAAQAD
ncbi:MAG TPA: VTT domain-containing protein [Xanthomonadales bacterium]|nr:VTT domain-containing protein [Xanthomonadales bacterium]